MYCAMYHVLYLTMYCTMYHVHHHVPHHVPFREHEYITVLQPSIYANLLSNYSLASLYIKLTDIITQGPGRHQYYRTDQATLAKEQINKK